MKLILLDETADCRESNEAIGSHFGAALSPLKHSCAGQSRTPEPEWKIDVSLNYPVQTIWRTERNFLSPHGASPISAARLRNFKLRGQPRIALEGPLQEPMSLRRDSAGEYISETFKEGEKVLRCATPRI